MHRNWSSGVKWNITHWKSFLNLSYSQYFSPVLPCLIYLQIRHTESLWECLTTELSTEELFCSLMTTVIKILKNYLMIHLISTVKPVQTIPAPPHRQSRSVYLLSHQVTQKFPLSFGSLAVPDSLYLNFISGVFNHHLFYWTPQSSIQHINGKLVK